MSNLIEWLNKILNWAAEGIVKKFSVAIGQIIFAGITSILSNIYSWSTSNTTISYYYLALLIAGSFYVIILVILQIIIKIKNPPVRKLNCHIVMVRENSGLIANLMELVGISSMVK
jgi:hypothetical protein